MIKTLETRHKVAIKVAKIFIVTDRTTLVRVHCSRFLKEKKIQTSRVTSTFIVSSDM
jgi:hypothetical protein